jgi:hypothetical protein
LRVEKELMGMGLGADEGEEGGRLEGGGGVEEAEEEEEEAESGGRRCTGMRLREGQGDDRGED